MTSFVSACFSGRVKSNKFRKKRLKGVRSMLSRKILKILLGVMAVLVLFEETLIKLFAPHLESFTKYDAFCSHIFDLCALTSGQEWIQKILVGGCNF